LSSSNDAGARPGSELRILVVEDSAPVRVRLAEMLTDPGVMRVTATAETEAEACELLNDHVFDVLVVDVELRQGSGVSVVRRERALRPGPASQPLIIILTNFAMPPSRERCLAAGADHFLEKLGQFDQLYPLILRRFH
jgi:CheY-like chemotaxis protein